MTGNSSTLNDPDRSDGIDIRVIALHTVLLPVYVGIVGSYAAVHQAVQFLPLIR